MRVARAGLCYNVAMAADGGRVRSRWGARWGNKGQQRRETLRDKKAWSRRCPTGGVSQIEARPSHLEQDGERGQSAAVALTPQHPVMRRDERRQYSSEMVPCTSDHGGGEGGAMALASQDESVRRPAQHGEEEITRQCGQKKAAALVRRWWCRPSSYRAGADGSEPTCRRLLFRKGKQANVLPPLILQLWSDEQEALREHTCRESSTPKKRARRRGRDLRPYSSSWPGHTAQHNVLVESLGRTAPCGPGTWVSGAINQSPGQCRKSALPSMRSRSGRRSGRSTVPHRNLDQGRLR